MESSMYSLPSIVISMRQNTKQPFLNNDRTATFWKCKGSVESTHQRGVPNIWAHMKTIKRCLNDTSDTVVAGW